MNQIRPPAETGLVAAHGAKLHGTGRRLTFCSAAVREWRDALMPGRSVESLTTAALATLGATLAFGGAATRSQGAGLPEGYTLGPTRQLGAEKIDLDNIAPKLTLAKENQIVNFHRRYMTDPFDASACHFFEVSGEPGQTNVLLSAQYWVHDPFPNSSGVKLPLLYHGPEDLTNAPAGEPASLGRHILINPFFDTNFKTNYVVTSKPVEEVYPERGGDPEFMAKFAGFRLYRYDFKNQALQGERFFFRPIHLWTASQGNGVSRFPASIGAYSEGVTTYYSDMQTDAAGDIFRVAAPVSPSWNLPSISPENLSMAISFEIAPIVPGTELPPPPSPTVYRSNSEGAPDGHGDFVTLSLISDGHPVWTAERTGSAVDGTWVRKAESSYNAPAGESLKIVKPIAASPSFFRLVR